MKKILILALCAVLMLSATVAQAELITVEQKQTFGLFSGTDAQGEAFEMKNVESKLVMINVWATYCSPCLTEMPDLSALATEYSEAGADFTMIGLCADANNYDGSINEATANIAVQVAEKLELSYPCIVADESILKTQAVKTQYVPTTFFLDAHGVILDTVVGSLSKEAWKEKIDAMLAQSENAL